MKKLYLIPCICLFVVVGVMILVYLMNGKKPFKTLEATDIDSATVRLLPPEKTFQIKDIDELVEILKEVVVYNKDDSYNEYAGQAVIFTLFMSDGSKKEITEYSPFIVVDGTGYKAEKKSCTALELYANEIKDEESIDANDISTKVENIIEGIKIESDFTDKEIEEIINGHDSTSLDVELVLIEFVEKNKLSEYIIHGDDGIIYQMEDVSKVEKRVLLECESSQKVIEITLKGKDIGDGVIAWKVCSCNLV